MRFYYIIFNINITMHNFIIAVRQVEIFNVNGAKLFSTTAKGNQAIDINTLPVNLYMVKISDAEGKSQFAKFMKQ